MNLWHLAAVAGFVISVTQLVIQRWPAHQQAQAYRREYDGSALPWPLCWMYWIGIR